MDSAEINSPFDERATDNSSDHSVSVFGTQDELYDTARQFE